MSVFKIKNRFIFFSLICLPIILINNSIVLAQTSLVQASTNNPEIKSKQIKDISKKENYSINVSYPEFSGSKNAQINKDINKNLKSKVNESVSWFKKNIVNDIKINQENTLDLSYETIFNDNKILSINLYESSFFKGSAHPNHMTYTFNYDLSNGKIVKLADLFKNNPNYLKKISDYCIDELIKSSKKNGLEPDLKWLKEGAGPKASNYQGFNITNKDLLIVFQDYQVTSYADGPPTIRIPLSKLKYK